MDARRRHRRSLTTALATAGLVVADRGLRDEHAIANHRERAGDL